MNTSVCDADALLQSTWTFCWDLLIAFVDVGFDHDANNACLTGTDLFREGCSDLGLITVIFIRVAFDVG